MHTLPHGDTSFPVAILKSSALRHNLDRMRRFCAQYGATLAPHGKTTMSPQLFGISHPCTTFDKWPRLLAVDDDYNVAFAVNTFF